MRCGPALTFLQASGKVTAAKTNDTVQAQVNLAKYPQETTNILHRDIIWFFLQDEEFVSRTISDAGVDWENFPANRVHELAK